MGEVVRLSNNSYKPITNTRGFAPGFVIYKKGAPDSQFLAHGRWFSPTSSTTKTGRHDIAEILLKVVSNTKNQTEIKSNLFTIMYLANYEKMNMRR